VETAEQVRKLLDDCRALVPTPLLCGIDQEGGSGRSFARDFSADAFGARAAPTWRSGRRAYAWPHHGRAASHARLNINFAPVMSIITQERSQLTNGLYSRSFGSFAG
jgi:hypothetical protein